MILKAYVESDPTRELDCAQGSVIKNQLNEELSSAKILITNVEEPIELHPYDYVLLKSTDGTWENKYLIDDFIEKYVNIDDKIYDYTINLMSETKFLEKWQIPNRVIVHSVQYGQLTIRERIYRFCEQYIPKVKYTEDGETRLYKYVFDFSSFKDTSSDEYKKFDTLCPDMSFSQPTLRGALTQLMQVVGCLPLVKDRKITFVDLTAEPTEFKIMDGRKYDVTTSNSSDSYVNRLYAPLKHVIDNENMTIVENIGFRDADNVFLKQTENLKLRTSFGISEIEKLDMCGIMTCKISFNDAYSLSGSGFARLVSHDGTQVLDGRESGCSIEFTYPATYTNLKIQWFNASVSQTSISSPTLLETKEYGTKVIDGTTYFRPQPTTITNWTYQIATRKVDGVSYRYVSIADYYDTFTPGVNSNFCFIWKKDITPIILEHKLRQILDKDYTQIPTITNGVEDLATSYYSTLEYTYLGNEISGFSNVWSFAEWWGTNNENEMNFLWKTIHSFDEKGDDFSLKNIADSLLLDEDDLLFHDSDLYTDSDMNPYAQIFFKIRYKAAADILMKIDKDSTDIKVPIEQLDTQEVSIPSFDDTYTKEQQKINRIGNNVFQIHQGQNPTLDTLQPLNSLYNDGRRKGIVFSQEIQVFDNFFEINYVATKDYVLKNYFTSIQTKYRAYEYTDASSALTRKENIKVYAYLGKNYYNADSNLVFGTTNMLLGDNRNGESIAILTGILTKGLDPISTGYKYVKISSIKSSDAYQTDAWVATTKNTAFFTVKDYDNAHYGPYIIDPETVEDLGGYTQSWYVFENKYYTEHILGFTNKTLFNNDIITNTSEAHDILSYSLSMPRMDEELFDLDDDTPFRIEVVGDNGNGLGTTKTAYSYYKTYEEQLLTTLQIELYTSEEEGVRWSKHLLELSDILYYGKRGSAYNFCVITSNDDLDDDIHEDDYSSDLKFTPETYFSWGSKVIDGFKVPFIKIKWGSVPEGSYLKVENSVEEGKYQDVIIFKRVEGAPAEEQYYLSYNDTKTLSVYSPDENTGLWSSKYMIDINNDTLDRKVKEV